MTELNFQPMFDYLVVMRDEVKTQTLGGIILSDVTQEKPSSGVVVKVGEGYTATDTGTFVPTRVKVGDRVLFPRGLGNEIELEDETYLLIKERDIMGILL